MKKSIWKYAIPLLGLWSMFEGLWQVTSAGIQWLIG